MDTLKTEGPSETESEFIFKTYELVEGKVILIGEVNRSLFYFLRLLLIKTLRDFIAHLSKGPSDLKQKCTQFPAPFLGIALNAFPLGVIHFFPSVSLRNHFLFG